MKNKDLASKYRPMTYAEVIGQKKIVESLKQTSKEQAFLFSGPSGVGKTTLARILCHDRGCVDLQEIDAASHTGVDDWREYQKRLYYRPQRGKVTGWIVDECHGLSKQAWQSLLKSVEEPPKHVVWCFCTTEPQKVPKAILTRCTKYALAPISETVLRKFADRVLKKEKHSLSDDVVDLIVAAADGSARELLKGLSVCWTAKDSQTASVLLRSVVAPTSEAYELCRELVRGTLTLPRAVQFLRSVTQDPETVRLVVRSYFYRVATGLDWGGKEKSEDEILKAVAVLQAFERPFYGESTLAPVLVALADLLVDDDG